MHNNAPYLHYGDVCDEHLALIVEPLNLRPAEVLGLPWPLEREQSAVSESKVYLRPFLVLHMINGKSYKLNK